MADYFDEMGWRPLGDGELPDHFLHLARLLRDFNMFQELGEVDRLPPPASKEAVAGLSEVEASEGEQCPVCLKAAEKGTKLVKMPCKHLFDSECILPWLAKVRGWGCRFFKICVGVWVFKIQLFSEIVYCCHCRQTRVLCVGTNWRQMMRTMKLIVKRS